MSLSALLVEDSPMIRESLIPVLEDIADLKVVGIAETPLEALAACEHHHDWRLMVLDLFLKDGNGLTVLEALGHRRPDQAIFVLTNYATQDSRARCLELGANGVFDKSTELDEFFDTCAAQVTARSGPTNP